MCVCIGLPIQGELSEHPKFLPTTSSIPVGHCALIGCAFTTEGVIHFVNLVYSQHCRSKLYCQVGVPMLVVTLKVVRLTHKDIELSQFIWHCQILVTEFWFSISAIPLSKALHFTTLNSLEMGYLPSQWLRRQRSDQVAELYKPFHSEASLLQVFPPVASMGE